MATNSFNSQQIKDYVTGQGYMDSAGKVTNAHGIYTAAQKYGVNGAQLDNALGWSSGTADKWVTDNGFQKLGAAGTTAGTTAGTGGASGTSRTFNPTARSSTTPQQANAKTLMGSVGGINANAGAQDAIAQAGAVGANVNRGGQYQTGQSVQGQAQQTEWNEGMSAAGRLDSMLNKNGTLMQSAATRGRQAAARSGLAGSTMAVEASQRAMIDSAAPIAQSDSQTYAQMQMANTQQANNWNSLDLDRMQNDRQYAATNQLEYDKLETTAKLKAAEMGLDWAKAQQSEKIEVMKMAQQEGQFQQTYGLESDRLDAELQQFAAKFGLEVDALELEKDKLSLQDRQFYDKLISDRDNLQYEWQQKYGIEELAQRYKVDITKLDGQIKKDLMGLEAQYKRDIGADENISNAWGMMVKEIGLIQNNPDLDDAAKRTNIQNVLGSFSAFTNFWKKTTGGSMDVSDLLSFGITDVGNGSDSVGVDRTGTTTTTDNGGGGDGGAGGE